MTRRTLLSSAAAAVAAAAADTKPNDLSTKLAAAMVSPVLRTDLVREPVRIATLELLRNGKNFFVRARAENGATGYADAHSSVMSAAYPILIRKVFPSFLGKDARELESLLADVYVAGSNYKWQGLPFWVSVAVTEIAILDMLGQVAKKPIGDMLGSVIREQVPVYRASGNRGNTPEVEIEYLKKILAETGAKAIKFRLGARMRYDSASTKRDLAMIPLTRKTFGDRMTIYADANGSYDVPIAIQMGKLMEEQKFRFFEEPVPFDFYDETKQVADALTIPIALGEQESSLRGFRRIIENRVARIVQPDLLYFGGLIRSVKVAHMAAIAGLECTPHMSGGGMGYLYVAHFASCVDNVGPHQEYKGEDDTLPLSSSTSSLKCESGMLKVPTGPGLGVVIDPDFISKASVVTA